MSPRVLVVDDDPQVLKLLRVNFELDGYDVVDASSGEEALKSVKRDHPDVVVCDVMMPGMDGIEVVRRLRADPKTAKLPVIVVSAKAQRIDLQAGQLAGADDYVTKPFDPQDLLDAVARLLKKK
jgi:CheY-like chemotaxis protein